MTEQEVIAAYTILFDELSAMRLYHLRLENLEIADDGWLRNRMTYGFRQRSHIAEAYNSFMEHHYQTQLLVGERWTEVVRRHQRLTKDISTSKSAEKEESDDED